jgi:hypothetical protein
MVSAVTPSSARASVTTSSDAVIVAVINTLWRTSMVGFIEFLQQLTRFGTQQISAAREFPLYGIRGNKFVRATCNYLGS